MGTGVGSLMVGSLVVGSPAVGSPAVGSRVGAGVSAWVGAFVVGTGVGVGVGASVGSPVVLGSSVASQSPHKWGQLVLSVVPHMAGFRHQLRSSTSHSPWLWTNTARVATATTTPWTAENRLIFPDLVGRIYF